MTGEVRVGTSGWQYDDWRGTVYPEGVGTARWLAHYVAMFPTVEVNSTFYRLARETATQRWADTAPPGFEFVLKGSRYITHQRKLREVGEAVGRFYAPVRPVLPRTAVVLWQLPPRWKRNLERLDTFLGGLPDGHRHAVEFRDEDWFHPDTYAEGRPAWVFFNNDHEGNAVRDARTLTRMLGDAARPWPPPG
jgi:uncharacterized protein YecE (DUF72 family)